MLIDIYNSNLTNSDLWEVENFTIKEVQRTMIGNREGYYPIPDFTIPVFQRSRIMAANFNNILAKPHWRLGCYIKQSIPAPSGVEPDAFADIASFRISLHTLQIFFPLPVVNAWQLRASVPEWHERAELTIYRFTGTIDAPLAQRLTEIETKLNTLVA